VTKYMYLTYYMYLVGIKRGDRFWHLSHMICHVHHTYRYDYTVYTNFSNFVQNIVISDRQSNWLNMMFWALPIFTVFKHIFTYTSVRLFLPNPNHDLTYYSPREALFPYITGGMPAGPAKGQRVAQLKSDF